MREQSAPGWEEEEVRFKDTGLENDIMVPRVCELDSILKGKGDEEQVVQASGFQEKRGTGSNRTGSQTHFLGCSELLGWVSYFTGPKENKAQRL